MEEKMLTGTLSCGFAFSVPEDIRDDMELLDALAEIQEGDPVAMSRVTEMILGKDQKKALYNALRNERGRVSVTAVSGAITEIFQQMGEAGKNS